MSVAEMKLAAISKISKLNTEAAVKEILEYLEKFSVTEAKPFDAEVFFNESKEKYGDVLKKLAQ
jgi:uncharacterized protein (DUF2164 family)